MFGWYIQRSVFREQTKVCNLNECHYSHNHTLNLLRLIVINFNIMLISYHIICITCRKHFCLNIFTFLAVIINASIPFFIISEMISNFKQFSSYLRPYILTQQRDYWISKKAIPFNYKDSNIEIQIRICLYMMKEINSCL